MKRKNKDPYYVCYRVKDRFGKVANGRVTFSTFDKARVFAQKVFVVENNTGGGSAQLISWGTRKRKY